MSLSDFTEHLDRLGGGMRTSQTIGELATALAKAQAGLSTVKKDKKANAGKFGYTYASLTTVMEAVLPHLAANNLCVLQSVQKSEGAIATITTRLVHASGEWIEGDCFMPIAGTGAQAVGSAITYGRRYGLSSLLGIVTDDDDDGAAATKQS